MKKILKQENGITLIALVVTIIVLLILAGISVMMLTGDNGILQRAGEAKKNTEQAQLEEEVDLAYLTYIGQLREKNNLGYYLNKIDDVKVDELVADTWYVYRGNSSVTISEDGEKMTGKTEIWDGTSVESPVFKEFNWYIYTPAQLKFLADFVNNENKLTSEQETLITNAGYRVSDVKMESTTMVYLMNNLDLGARAGTGSTEKQKWENESNAARKWRPIGINGSTKSFIGIFEGNNNTIKGIYVNQTESCAGLFGNSNTIQHLTIKNSYIKGGMGTGGIVGVLKSGKLENCHTKNTVVTLADGNNCIIGGMVGFLYGNIEHCSNSGKVITTVGVTAKDYKLAYCGGIVGAVEKFAGVDNCTNYGNIVSTSDGRAVGGIAGSIYRGADDIQTKVQNCSNYARVEGFRLVGGIVGGNNGNSIIKNCYNEGEIIGRDQYIGGILGASDVSSYSNINCSILNCYSKGKISGVNFGFIMGSKKLGNNFTSSDLYYLSSLEANSNNRVSIEATITQAIDNNFNSLDEFLKWLEN